MPEDEKKILGLSIGRDLVRPSRERKQIAMQYLLLIYRNEQDAATASDQSAMTKEYGEYTQGIIKSGHFKAGDALQPSSTATTVRVREGRTLTTDGPFAETREQLAGYYLVEAKDLDDAIKVAAKIPNARDGAIEVRPVRMMPRP
jgi:hypothetical protein